MKLPRVYDWPRAEADVVIGRRLLTKDAEHELKSCLTFSNPEYHAALQQGVDVSEMSPHILAYEQHDGIIRVPRHTPWGKLGLRQPRLIHPPTKILPYEFTGSFRDYQEPGFDVLRKSLTRNRDGIMELRCGWGKTVLAAAAFCWVQRPGLAIVTQLLIGDQWEEALSSFTNIPANQIGRIGDGHNEWDRDFVISTVHTLAKKSFAPEFYRRFGVVFFDEVHRLGAPLFGRVVSAFTGTRVGLTATLQRTDGMHRVFMLHVGAVLYEDKAQPLKPEVHFVRTKVKKDIGGFRQWGRRGKLNMAKIVTHLSRLEDRQRRICTRIKEAYASDRKILVLSDRKEELLALQAMLRREFGVHREDIGICVGSLNGRKIPTDVRLKALACPIILATAQLVKEGLDKKEIDSLLILYPQSSEAFTEQAIGRILREADNKKVPTVLIFYDEVYVEENREEGRVRRMPFVQKAVAMQRTVKRLGYTIKRAVAA